MILYVAQEAAPAAATGAPRAEGLDLDLADAACAWVTDTVLLMALADGSLTMLTLHVENGTVRRMKVGARWDPLSRTFCVHVSVAVWGGPVPGGVVALSRRMEVVCLVSLHVLT